MLMQTARSNSFRTVIRIAELVGINQKILIFHLWRNMYLSQHRMLIQSQFSRWPNSTDLIFTALVMARIAQIFFIVLKISFYSEINSKIEKKNFKFFCQS